MVKRILILLNIALATGMQSGCALSASSSPAELRAYIARSEEVERPTEEQLFRLACAKWWLHDNAGALKSVNRAISLNQKSPEFFLLRGLIRKVSGHYTASLVDLNKAVELGSKQPEIFADRAYVKLMLKDITGAMADAEKCLTERPSDTTSWFVKGGCLMERKEPREAITALTKAIELDSTDSAALRLRALAYRQLGKTDMADADLLRANSLDAK